MATIDRLPFAAENRPDRLKAVGERAGASPLCTGRFDDWGAFAPIAAAPDPASADFPAVVDLGKLDGKNGFRFDGIDVKDYSGRSISSAGDVNGDGFDDIVIGAYRADPGGDTYAGETYVVFGKRSGFAAGLDLAALDGVNGFRLDGIDAIDFSGISVSSAGDINGDGFDDILIGAPGGYGDFEGSSECYVVYGKAGGFAASLDLAAIDGSNGLRIDGLVAYDRLGRSVSEAGDVNGDGVDDIVIAAYRADPDGVSAAGACYVVFGVTGGFGASFDLAALDGTNGFRLDGANVSDNTGFSLSSAGDVNGDGFGDIVIGAFGADPGGGGAAGVSYVVFGRAAGFAASLDLAALDGGDGFRLDGIDTFDFSGFSVSGAGDVNGDGFDDIVIGAYLADPGGETYAGESYVVFGRAGGFAASLALATLDGSNGFRLPGIEAYDKSGHSVSAAGDVNGDGFDDVIIGAFRANPDGSRLAGASYVVFGKAGGFAVSFDLASLDGANGFRLDGANHFDTSGYSVSAAGDVNGDGFDDIMIAADRADPGGDGRAGASYVVFGRAPTTAVERVGAEGGQTIRGGDFDDTLRGEGGNDSLVGGKGADVLDGGKDADVLQGARGDDTLRGGGGRDIVNGGAGGDRIEAPGSFDRTAADVIYGFETGVDEIALDAGAFGLAPGALDAGSFVVSNQAQDADNRLIYKANSGKIYFDPDGTGAQEQVLIATLVGAPAIDAGDFIVI